MADSKVRANMLNLSGDYPFTGSVTGHVADGSITAAKLSGTISASKLTGALPALDGSALTGLAGITKNASDPVVTTNPSGGVGTLWANTTSGEMFVCTDATAGANVWTNVGPGTGNVFPWYYGGSSYGFMTGHQSDNSINKFNFASSGAATDFGDLAGATSYIKSGHSDKDNSYGYHAGGYPAINVIARFSMVSQGTSNDVGNLRQVTSDAASATSNTHAYVIGHGWNGMPAGTDGTFIDKFAFASSVDSSAWGSLMTAQYNSGNGQTNGDASHGYLSGGNPLTDSIQKINLNSAETSTEIVATLTQARHSAAGNSSSTHGYTSGGHNGSGLSRIDKFSFATDSDATNVGDMQIAIHQRGGSSSLAHGYIAGGVSGNAGIERFSFATDGDSASIGNLAQGLTGPGGTQV